MRYRLNSHQPKVYAYINRKLDRTWWILTCHVWSTSPVQIGEGQTKTDTVYLEADSNWSEAAFQVKGSGIIVDYNAVAKLKDGNTTLDTQISTENAHLINQVMAVDYSGDRYNSATDEDWKYVTQFAVTQIEP